MAKLQAIESKSASKSTRTRQRVLAAAARVFREQGYAAASLRQIADAADMQAGSLYYHFDSKDELAEAVMDRGVTEALKRAKESVALLPADADAIDAIQAAFTGHLTYLLEEADFAVATLRMMQQTPEAVRVRHLRKQRTTGRFFGELFEQAQNQGLIDPSFNLSAMRMLLLGALNWSPEWFNARGLSAEELVQQLGELMRGGLQRRRAMKIGFMSFNTEYTMRADRLAAALEERGFESLWLPEHTHIPVPENGDPDTGMPVMPDGGYLPEEYRHMSDPLTSLAAAAAVTQNLLLGTCICLVNQHHPDQPCQIRGYPGST